MSLLIPVHIYQFKKNIFLSKKRLILFLKNLQNMEKIKLGNIPLKMVNINI